jgi:site-specific DNA-methyltransferase (adenine-specific)
MPTNQLYYGDNLDILRTHIPDESVDLIYIDPPFNSNQAYNVIFSEADGSSSQAQIQAFEDTWRWGETTEQAYHELIGTAPHLLVETIKSFRGFLTETNLMAYLVMMGLRLVELHRVLKPTGSFYLHCDPTASHYLKIILDQIFGIENFQNEIVWKRTSSHNDPKRFGGVGDRILFYSKAKIKTFNVIYSDYSPEQLSRYKYEDERGRYRAENLTAPHYSPTRTVDWRGTHPGSNRQWRFSVEELERLYAKGYILLRQDGCPRKDGLKVYLDEAKGAPAQNIWDDIPRIGNTSKERLGYPTQKPEALLERIIQASSNEGDVVLDTFCGCGTAVAVAQRLNRRWIRVDITHLAIALLKYRLADAFGDDVEYEIIGEPKDTASAKALAAQDRYQFQWWALSLIRARPYQGKKKGADEGVDGVIYYQDVDPDNPKKMLAQKIIVQVKSGKVSVRDIRELKSVVDSQDAVIGVFITLNRPTQPMVKEAAAAGRFQWLHVAHTTYPKIQIRTIDELLSGNGIEYPQTPIDVTFRRAERAAPQSHQLEIEA